MRVRMYDKTTGAFLKTVRLNDLQPKFIGTIDNAAAIESITPALAEAKVVSFFLIYFADGWKTGYKQPYYNGTFYV